MRSVPGLDGTLKVCGMRQWQSNARELRMTAAGEWVPVAAVQTRPGLSAGFIILGVAGAVGAFLNNSGFRIEKCHRLELGMNQLVVCSQRPTG